MKVTLVNLQYGVYLTSTSLDSQNVELQTYSLKWPNTRICSHQGEKSLIGGPETAFQTLSFSTIQQLVRLTSLPHACVSVCVSLSVLAITFYALTQKLSWYGGTL